MGEVIQPVKATLSDFIEERSRLVTSIAAFIALTVFAGQLDNDLKDFISALTLMAAVLLTWELFKHLPDRPREWPVELFSDILPLLTAFMVWVWLSKFPVVWIPLAVFALTLFVFLGLTSLFSYALAKLIDILVGKLIKRPLRLNETNRKQLVCFLLSAVFAFWILVHASRWLGVHPVTIQFPAWVTSQPAKINGYEHPFRPFF